MSDTNPSTQPIVVEARSLTPADALQAIRDDIHAEDTLISGRVTWYVTSQAFLLTAFAQSWNAGFTWPFFFHQVLPIAAIVLSVMIFGSIYAATWAQEMYMREQSRLVDQIRRKLVLSNPELLALEAYERTMVSHRSDAKGRAIGSQLHVMVRVPPIAMPIGFAALWVYAYVFASSMGH